MGNIYTNGEKSAYETVPILSCELWIDLYPEDGVFFCASDKVLDATSFIMQIVFLYQIWVYRKYYQIPWNDHRIIILILCLISCLNCFTHYSFLHGTMKGYTYFIISIFRITIFSLVFYYFCMKASKLMKNKKYTLNTLKGLMIAGVLISSFTGAYIDFYIYDKMKGDGLQLCHTIFILLE